MIHPPPGAYGISRREQSSLVSLPPDSAPASAPHHADPPFRPASLIAQDPRSQPAVRHAESRPSSQHGPRQSSQHASRPSSQHGTPHLHPPVPMQFAFIPYQPPPQLRQQGSPEQSPAQHHQPVAVPRQPSAGSQQPTPDAPDAALAKNARPSQMQYSKVTRELAIRDLQAQAEAREKAFAEAARVTQERRERAQQRENEMQREREQTRLVEGPKTLWEKREGAVWEARELAMEQERSVREAQERAAQEARDRPVQDERTDPRQIQLEAHDHTTEQSTSQRKRRRPRAQKPRAVKPQPSREEQEHFEWAMAEARRLAQAGHRGAQQQDEWGMRHMTAMPQSTAASQQQWQVTLDQHWQTTSERQQQAAPEQQQQERSEPTRAVEVKRSDATGRAHSERAAPQSAEPAAPPSLVPAPPLIQANETLCTWFHPTTGYTRQPPPPNVISSTAPSKVARRPVQLRSAVWEGNEPFVSARNQTAASVVPSTASTHHHPTVTSSQRAYPTTDCGATSRLPGALHPGPRGEAPRDDVDRTQVPISQRAYDIPADYSLERLFASRVAPCATCGRAEADTTSVGVSPASVSCVHDKLLDECTRCTDLGVAANAQRKTCCVAREGVPHHGVWKRISLKEAVEQATISEESELDEEYTLEYPDESPEMPEVGGSTVTSTEGPQTAAPLRNSDSGDEIEIIGHTPARPPGPSTATPAVNNHTTRRLASFSGDYEASAVASRYLPTNFVLALRNGVFVPVPRTSPLPAGPQGVPDQQGRDGGPSTTAPSSEISTSSQVQREERNLKRPWEDCAAEPAPAPKHARMSSPPPPSRRDAASETRTGPFWPVPLTPAVPTVDHFRPSSVASAAVSSDGTVRTQSDNTAAAQALIQLWASDKTSDVPQQPPTSDEAPPNSARVGIPVEDAQPPSPPREDTLELSKSKQAPHVRQVEAESARVERDEVLMEVVEDTGEIEANATTKSPLVEQHASSAPSHIEPPIAHVERVIEVKRSGSEAQQDDTIQLVDTPEPQQDAHIESAPRTESDTPVVFKAVEFEETVEPLLRVANHDTAPDSASPLVAGAPTIEAESPPNTGHERAAQEATLSNEIPAPNVVENETSLVKRTAGADTAVKPAPAAAEALTDSATTQHMLTPIATSSNVAVPTERSSAPSPIRIPGKTTPPPSMTPTACPPGANISRVEPVTVESPTSPEEPLSAIPFTPIAERHPKSNGQRAGGIAKPYTLHKPSLARLSLPSTPLPSSPTARSPSQEHGLPPRQVTGFAGSLENGYARAIAEGCPPNDHQLVMQNGMIMPAGPPDPQPAPRVMSLREHLALKRKRQADASEERDAKRARGESDTQAQAAIPVALMTKGGSRPRLSARPSPESEPAAALESSTPASAAAEGQAGGTSSSYRNVMGTFCL
ncbi:hypothetical protein BD626DRAFT_203965 [Schizophyllum amplum]|uniref:Uncharacterized protein n=1 Tax=Schizophyllum amplum TaxID=97359 RepID=A0A550BZP4_9AGAR|nr:hypothetical protein BD626DRAFT_203965 [Auriculariopsis ampla]